MKPLLTCLMLASFALPAHAGEATIVETDDGYVVELSGEATEKTTGPGVPPAAPGASAAAAVAPPPAAPTPPGSSATPFIVPNRTPSAQAPADRPERPARAQNRRDRTRPSRGVGSGFDDAGGDAVGE